ncbi:MAG TPA: 50S ribosomal protein L25 [Gemmataceae bacterium]|jgi:large subunit ribosomal protein L25|nr:50S ribosomal protein L25 [Gemmataceae bacterium]
MAESLVLVAEARAGRGKQAARRLRRTGKVPAVLYGHKEETLSVALPLEEVEKAIRRGVRVVDLKAGGKEEKALIRDVQWDHLGKDLLHVDFARVAADERIVLTVPIELRGTAPGVTAGGVLDQPIHTLSIECLAISIPDTIRVNIAELQIGSAIHVRDLVLPAGVKAMSDPEAIVVQVKQPVAEEEAPVAAEAAEAAEPEVIGAKEKAEEEEESE